MSCYFLDGIALKYKMEYSMKMEGLHAQRKTITTAMKNQGNYESMIQSAMATSAKQILLTPIQLIHGLDE